MLKNPLGSIWEHHHVWLGAIGDLHSTSAQKSPSAAFSSITWEATISALFPPRLPASYVALYWGGAMVGRFIGVCGAPACSYRPQLVGICAIVDLLTGRHFHADQRPLAMWSMLLVGLFNSIMFPSIFTLGTAHMGPLTGKASGLLVQAIVGGAIIP